MAKNKLESIEGNKIYVGGLKIVPKTPPKKCRNGFMVHRLKVKRKGEGEIEEEYNNKAPIYDNNSKLDKGEKVKGKQLYGLHCKPLGKIKKGGRSRSGKHTGQYTFIKKKCLLEEVEDYFNNTPMKHPQDKYLEN